MACFRLMLNFDIFLTCLSSIDYILKNIVRIKNYDYPQKYP